MRVVSRLLLVTTALSTISGSLASAGGLAPTAPAAPVLIAAPVSLTTAGSHLRMGANGCFGADDGYGLFASYTSGAGANGVQLQLDGQLASTSDGDVNGEVLAQIYKRFDSGLYGISTGYRGGAAGAEDGFRVAGLGEYYAGGLTMSGYVGWDFGYEEAIGEGRVSAYLGNNTKFYAGVAQDIESYQFVGAEHMLTPNLSGFIEGQTGGVEDVVKVGLTWHFGATTAQSGGVVASAVERSLITRDRQEFIPLWMQPCAAVPVSDEPPPVTEEPTEGPTEGPTGGPTGDPTRPPPVDPLSSTPPPD